MGVRRGKESKGTSIEDSWERTMGRLTVGGGRDRVGLSDGEKCGAIVTGQ